MKHSGLRKSLGIAGAVVLSLALWSVARADSLQPPSDAPPAIAVEAGNKVFLIVHAVGTQNYTCTAAGTWSAAVPQADLFADNVHQIGTHYAGPTWELKDGSKVVGMRITGVTVSSDAIPWLLLKAVSTSGSPGNDRLVGTTWIQRVHTTGGLPPAGACSAGATASVPYTADYYFYRSSN
jgi:hypothetical protein